MSSVVSSNIPEEILTEFFQHEEIADIQCLNGGMINATFLIEFTKGKVIMQKLSPIFDVNMIEDYLVLSKHLQKDGWEVAEVIKNNHKGLYSLDNDNNVWRAFSFIESDSDECKDLSLYGEILAKTHYSLAKLNYTPKFSLPHFHETAYYAEKLEKSKDEIPTAEGKNLANRVMTAYTSIPRLPETGNQLIHADPRTNNVLLRDGKPFMFIDWDTLMLGTIWIDIGDMLRSIAEDKVMAGLDVDIEELVDVIGGYYRVSSHGISEAKFKSASLQSAQIIALELTMRFLADYHEGDKGYFTWDEKEYSSRHHHNMDRAYNQWKIYSQIQDYIERKVE